MAETRENKKLINKKERKIAVVWKSACHLKEFTYVMTESLKKNDWELMHMVIDSGTIITRCNETAFFW